MTRTPKLILVTGHPRSGTWYMASLLKAYGLDVKHECMGKHGISSWMFATDVPEVPISHDKSAPHDYSFDYVIQVVREPIATIESVAFTEDRYMQSVKFRKRFICIDDTAPPLLQATQSIIAWNKLIRARNPSLAVQVERAPEVLSEFFWSVGVVLKDNPVLPPTNVNSRVHPKPGWEEIKKHLTPFWHKELIRHANFYGYNWPEMI